MTLSKNDILKQCKEKKLVTPFKEDNIQTCSYDLTFGGEYYFYRPEDKDEVCVREISKGATLKIPADAICYIITAETVKMPDNLTASISLAFGLIKKGVMLSAQPPYDPGYHGKTVALLHNLSDEPVEIRQGQHVLNIVFERLSSPVAKDDLYKGSYQGLDRLSDYCTEVKRGGVYTLMQDLQKQKKKFENSIPNLITIITVIIGVVTILVTLITSKSLFFSSENAQNDVIKPDEDIINFIIPANGENEIIINVGDRSYLIDFESTTMEELQQPSQNAMNGE